MPLLFLRRLTARTRTEAANRHLARFLAFIAGATNAGGLLAVGQYTSHMSGIISAMADNLAVGALPLVLGGAGAVFAFLAGAFATTLMVRWARSFDLESQYALPLLVESALLLLFGLTGRVFEAGHDFLGTVMLLCFTMGLQNAIITKISDAVIRTTHMTGIVTDIGISLGRLFFARFFSATLKRDLETRHADVRKLRLHTSLVGLFFTGGFIGALGFKRIGFLFTLPLAAILVLLAVVPVVEDLRRIRERRAGRRPGFPEKSSP